MWRWKFTASPLLRWVLLALLLGAALRIPLLEQRPMHADEAIQADRLGTLLESRTLHYDPTEYHGPALALSSLPGAWLAGADRHAELRERTVRAAPVLFGLVAVLIAAGIGARRGAAAGAVAAAFTALSPGLVYFSRYYIPEMLLVCFSAALLYCCIRSIETPQLLWPLLAGASAGLMFAAKETAVLSFAAVICAYAAVRPKLPWSHAAAGGLAAIAVAAALYTPARIFDAVLSLIAYAERGLAPQLHAHPWHYYFVVLLQSGDLFFLLLAFSAVPLARARDTLARFLFVYSTVLTLAYCLLPYKTPWCALGFLHGWILLAALGVSRAPRKLRLAALVVMMGLAVQSWRLAFPLAAQPINPYAYAHTLPEIYALLHRIEAAAASHPDGPNLHIDVVTAENLWPLPWYLRRYPNVMWWREAPPADKQAPLLLVSPAMEEVVAQRLYESPAPRDRQLYYSLLPDPLWLRPGVEIKAYAVLSLLDGAE